VSNTAFIKPALAEHKARLLEEGLQTLFAKDTNRFEQFSAQCNGLLLDYSKNLIDEDSFAQLLDLAEKADLRKKVEAMFKGEPINNTEKRQVLHTALRANPNDISNAIAEDITTAKNRIYELSDKLSSGKLKGHTGKQIDTVVNIGVGGSDLGPYMAVEALTAYHAQDTRFVFVSNIDPVHISRTLKSCDPETTLFIICSKTFTTLETLANANAARDWFLTHQPDEAAIGAHFLAVSTNLEAAAKFGIPEQNLYPMWDWVGGRYSLWSAIGITIALAIGKQQFESFLSGAREMDQHFRHADFKANLPVIMALLGIWYSDYFGAQTQALICYDQNLSQFPAYLQQLDMESNGKSVKKNGQAVDYATGAILWGGVGTNTQHSFHQLIHQGTHLIPVDFIVGTRSTDPISDQQAALFSNCLAQSQAMMQGRSKSSLIEELNDQGVEGVDATFLADHRYVEGNKPSNTLVYEKLTPYVLGQLIALYEHKIFAQSVLWDINAFDQWGVELGKQLSKQITSVLHDPGKADQQDSSTRGLIEFFSRHQK